MYYFLEHATFDTLSHLTLKMLEHVVRRSEFVRVDQRTEPSQSYRLLLLLLLLLLSIPAFDNIKLTLPGDSPHHPSPGSSLAALVFAWLDE